MPYDWFVRNGTQELGPLNAKQLKDAEANGSIGPTTLIGKAEKGCRPLKWIVATKVQGLRVTHQPSPTVLCEPPVIISNHKKYVSAHEPDSVTQAWNPPLKGFAAFRGFIDGFIIAVWYFVASQLVTISILIVFNVLFNLRAFVTLLVAVPIACFSLAMMFALNYSWSYYLSAKRRQGCPEFYRAIYTGNEGRVRDLFRNTEVRRIVFREIRLRRRESIFNRFIAMDTAVHIAFDSTFQAALRKLLDDGEWKTRNAARIALARISNYEPAQSYKCRKRAGKEIVPNTPTAVAPIANETKLATSGFQPGIEAARNNRTKSTGKFRGQLTFLGGYHKLVQRDPSPSELQIEQYVLANVDDAISYLRNMRVGIVVSGLLFVATGIVTLISIGVWVETKTWVCFMTVLPLFVFVTWVFRSSLFGREQVRKRKIRAIVAGSEFV